MFEERPKQNPLQVMKNGTLHWLTTQDLSFLTLFALNLLVEECWKRRILLLGLTKDTAARDFKNHVLPVMVSNQLWNSDLSQEQLSRIPNTDRMLLQTLSVFNHESIPVPWSLIEYDSSFLMIVPELFGHNKPLFIADKVAKWHNEEMRKIIDTTGKWLMNSPKLRHFVFYMSTFRERRSEIEGARRDNI